MVSLVFYTTLGCHLCEQAQALVIPLLPEGCDIKYVDISESDQLIERYGVRIPVIARTDTHAELGWPFDQSMFLVFIK